MKDDQIPASQNRIYITQLIYIKEGQQDIFHQFEIIAIPIISKYKGRLMLRLRPNKTSTIETNIDNPYEVHLVEFLTEDDFNSFMQDEERKKFLHLKDQSIKAVTMIKGIKI
ncbi:MAG: DUF1330 domain-containing protein [Ginsengibacter sp.]